MRISKALRESMIMHGNLNKPAKPLSKESKELRDTARSKARNKRKALSKIPFIIIPLPARAGNPKKDTSVRRERNRIGTYIPYVLLNISEFRTKHYPKRKKQNPQMDINTRLIARAHQAHQDGGYFNINQKATHKEPIT